MTPRRPVLMSVELMEQFASRTAAGDRVSVEWGEPGPDGFYEPRFTVHYDDNLVAAECARIAREVRRVLRDTDLAGLELGLLAIVNPEPTFHDLMCGRGGPGSHDPSCSKEDR